MDKEKARRWAGIGYVNLATLVWASNMVIGRMVRDDIGPITLSAARFTIDELLGQAIYEAQQAEGGAEGAKGDDNVVDADYEEINDDDNDRKRSA